MKIKNIEIGGYIQAKKGRKKLIAGHCYRAADKDTHDKTVKILAIDDSCDDSLWFCVNDFRKPRPQPQLKQLDQSVFDGLDEKWRFAAIDSDGDIYVYDGNPTLCDYEWVTRVGVKFLFLARGYDTTNWQNSLIERDIAKELAEVDLSSELTGSELCRAMLERGDNYIMCVVGTIREVVIIDTFQNGYFYSKGVRYLNPKPINNQGEPLTASEVGL